MLFLGCWRTTKQRRKIGVELKGLSFYHEGGFVENEGRQVNKAEPALCFQGEAGITGEQVRAVELIAGPRQKRGRVQ